MWATPRPSSGTIALGDQVQHAVASPPAPPLTPRATGHPRAGDTVWRAARAHAGGPAAHGQAAEAAAEAGAAARVGRAPAAHTHSMFAPRALQLIDPKRSNNIAISLAQFRAFSSYEDLLRAISRADTTALPAEKLHMLVELMPTPADLTAIAVRPCVRVLAGRDADAVVQGYTGELSELAPAEQFFMAVSKVPRATAKASALLAVLQLGGACKELGARATTLRKACDQVRRTGASSGRGGKVMPPVAPPPLAQAMGSERLASFLTSVLEVGNFMNAVSGLPPSAACARARPHARVVRAAASGDVPRRRGGLHAGLAAEGPALPALRAADTWGAHSARSLAHAAAAPQLTQTRSAATKVTLLEFVLDMLEKKVRQLPPPPAAAPLTRSAGVTWRQGTTESLQFPADLELAEDGARANPLEMQAECRQLHVRQASPALSARASASRAPVACAGAVRGGAHGAGAGAPGAGQRWRDGGAGAGRGHRHAPPQQERQRWQQQQLQRGHCERCGGGGRDSTREWRRAVRACAAAATHTAVQALTRCNVAGCQ